MFRLAWSAFFPPNTVPLVKVVCVGSNVSFNVSSHKLAVQDICIIEYPSRKRPLAKTKVSHPVEGEAVHAKTPLLRRDFLNWESRLSGWWLKARSHGAQGVQISVDKYQGF